MTTFSHLFFKFQDDFFSPFWKSWDDSFPPFTAFRKFSRYVSNVFLLFCLFSTKFVSCSTKSFLGGGGIEVSPRTACYMLLSKIYSLKISLLAENPLAFNGSAYKLIMPYRQIVACRIWLNWITRKTITGNFLKKI